jgi:hypothetical protein
MIYFWIVIYIVSIVFEIGLCLKKYESLGLIIPLIVGIVSLSYMVPQTYFLFVSNLFVFLFIYLNKIIIKLLTKNDARTKSIIKDL